MSAAAPPSPADLLALAEARLAEGSRKSALKYARRASAAAAAAGQTASAVAARRLTASLKILLATDHHSALLLPKLSSLPTVKRQYFSLTTLLTPRDQDPLPPPAVAAAAGEALSRIASAFAALSSAAVAGAGPTFWTACNKCRLLHEFDRKYVGYRLACPGCTKSFLANEVPPPSKSKNHSDDDDDLEMKTLAEMQREIAGPKVNGSGKRKEAGDAASRGGNQHKIRRSEENGRSRKKAGERKEVESSQSRGRQLKHTAEVNGNDSAGKKGGKEADLGFSDGEEQHGSNYQVKVEELGMMPVVDSDFYDFDKDRTEFSIKKGQVWAVYGDGDGMPRDYALIGDVNSVRPFNAKVTWLDLQPSSRDVGSADTSGMQISCGMYKVGKPAVVDMVNVFSHLVDCERAAKALYRIYPKKGSVWALYAARDASERGGWNYDMIICLNSYSDVYGLSIAYLDKVPGYRSIFKRKAVGYDEVHLVEKDEFGRFSHQVPARRVPPKDGADLPAECWELDPASLTQELLSIG